MPGIYAGLVRYQIRTDFLRPDLRLVERAAATDVGVTGVHAGPRQVMDAGLRPLDQTWRICGPAFTVRPEYTDDLLMRELAGKPAQVGEVIVVDAGGRADRACCGMGMSTAARAAGCAGVVLDRYRLAQRAGDLWRRDRAARSHRAR